MTWEYSIRNEPDGEKIHMDYSLAVCSALPV